MEKVLNQRWNNLLNTEVSKNITNINTPLKVWERKEKRREMTCLDQLKPIDLPDSIIS